MGPCSEVASLLGSVATCCLPRLSLLGGRHTGRALLLAFRVGRRGAVLAFGGSMVVLREANSWSTCGRTLGAGRLLAARPGTGNALRGTTLASWGRETTGRWEDLVDW